MMNREYLVSVIIPTYNRADKIYNSIYSVINQTYKTWEIIVIDDNSEDNTEEIIKEFMQRYKNIRYIKLKENKGPANARNIGIDNSKGGYIAFLDSDNTWEAEHLQKNISAMKKYGVKASYSFWKERTLEGKEIEAMEKGTILRMKFDKAVKDSSIKMLENRIAYLKSPDYIEYACINKVYCTHINTLVLNKEVINTIGYFDVSLATSEDDDFSFRVLLHYDAVVIMENLFVYHQGIDNLYNFYERQI